MLNISNNNIISITRGDSGYFYFDLNLGNNIFPEYYTLTNLDTVYMGVMESGKPFEEAIIRKAYAEEGSQKAKFVFNSNDTENLVPGVYYYSIKIETLINAEGRVGVTTVIPKRKFIIID